MDLTFSETIDKTNSVINKLNKLTCPSETKENLSFTNTEEIIKNIITKIEDTVNYGVFKLLLYIVRDIINNTLHTKLSIIKDIDKSRIFSNILSTKTLFDYFVINYIKNNTDNLESFKLNCNNNIRNIFFEHDYLDTYRNNVNKIAKNFKFRHKFIYYT